MKPIYILALHNVRTGGPEAIHQLSDALIEQGFDARMVYFDRGQIAALEQALPQDGYHFGARENPIEEYARYKVNVTDSVPNTEGVIVVLPETLCHLAPKFDRATVLIWWLSVDNGFGALDRVNLNHLRKPNVSHAYQSRYAERFGEALQFASAGMLSDYTADLTEYATPLPMSERPKLVAFNVTPRKVAADIPAIVEAIHALDPEIECVPVHGERREVAELFAKARVYVDLGSFPGKDRMPREAASMGCQVIVGSPAGASGEVAATFLDLAMSPIHAAHAIALTMGSGGVIAAPANERATFITEVRNVFSQL